MPKGFRPLGIILSVIGIILLILVHQFNYKPDFLNLKVFAFYSFYIEAKSFTFITHQMIQEIAGVLQVVGLFFIAFSREKVESEFLDALRLKAFLISAYLNLFYLLISILFFFGFGFVGTLVVFIVFWLAAYILGFRYLLYRFKITQ